MDDEVLDAQFWQVELFDVTVEGEGGAAPAGESPGLTLEGLRAELERFRSKTNSELADRRKAIDALKESLARPSDETSAGRGASGEAEPPKADAWQDKFKLGMEIGGLERALPAEIVERVRGRVGDPLAAPDLYAQALRVASDAVELRAGKTDVTSEDRGGEPVRTRVKPPDAGGAHSAGVPRTYAELRKMSAAERAAWRDRDPDGFAKIADQLYETRFKKPV
jgi:hypothetical protein